MKRQKKKISQLQLVKLLKSLKPDKQSCLLPFLNQEALDVICCAAHNVLFENWNLKKSQKRKLMKVLKERDMKALSNKTNSIQRRRKIIIQYGGSPLSLILSTAIPILTSLLFKSKK